MSKAKFSKVSEWIAAGACETGFYMLENPDTISERALAFKANKRNEYGNAKPALCWVPKSQAKEVVNDFYIHAPSTVYLIPEWLYTSKCDDGYEF